jgi:hypothetical protein
VEPSVVADVSVNVLRPRFPAGQGDKNGYDGIKSNSLPPTYAALLRWREGREHTVSVVIDRLAVMAPISNELLASRYSAAGVVMIFEFRAVEDSYAGNRVNVSGCDVNATFDLAAPYVANPTARHADVKALPA